MKKILFIVAIISFILTIARSQETYSGFAIEGKVTSNYTFSNGLNFSNFSYQPIFSYFINRNNQLLLKPVYESRITQLSPIMSKKIFDLGFGYAYIHWINNRIGIKGSINFDNLLTENIQIGLGLALEARVTERVDIGFSLGYSNIYSKLNNFPFEIIGTVPDPKPEYTLLESKGSRFGFSTKFLPNLHVRYRLTPDRLSVNTEPLALEKEIKFSVGVSFDQSKTQNTYINDTGNTIVESTSNYRASLKSIFNPISTLSYGLEFNVFGYNSNYKYRDVSFGPLVRFNWFNMENFGLYAEGFGNFKNSWFINDNSSGSSGMVFGGRAGVNYIIKKRVLLSAQFSNFSVYKPFGNEFGFTTVSFNPLNFEGIAISVLF